MAYTLSSAITEVRNSIGEATASYWTDAEITDFIQKGTLDVCAQARAYEATGDITLATSTQEYAVTTDMIIFLDAVYKPGSGVYKSLIRVTPEKLGNLRAAALTGPPTHWYTFAGKIGVYPVPTVSENTKTITVYGYKRTDDITAIPFEYQSPVIDYAIAFALWKDRRNAEASQAWNRYASSLAALKTGVIDAKLDGDSWKDRNIPVASIGVRPNG